MTEDADILVAATSRELYPPRTFWIFPQVERALQWMEVGGGLKCPPRDFRYSTPGHVILAQLQGCRNYDGYHVIV